MEHIELICKIAEDGCNRIPDLVKEGCKACPIRYDRKCNLTVKDGKSYSTGQYVAIEELNRRKVELWKKMK